MRIRVFAGMVLMVSALIMLGSLFSRTDAGTGSCLFRSCRDLCKDQKRYCNGTNKAFKDDLLQQCSVGYEEDMADCTATWLDTSTNCESLCGDDLKSCLKEGKNSYKACKKAAKTAQKTCKASSKAQAKADKKSCKRQADACKQTCGSHAPPKTPKPTPTPASTPTTTPAPTPSPGGDTLAGILGTWEFQTTIISTFYDHYLLDHIDNSTGTPVIVGTDLDQGDLIVAARSADLSSDPFPYDFALLDPGIIACDFFVFSRTAKNTVVGADILTYMTGNTCSGFITGNLNPMVGYRTSPSIAPEDIARPGERQANSLRISEDRAQQLSPLNKNGSADEGLPINQEVLENLLDAIQAR